MDSSIKSQEVRESESESLRVNGSHGTPASVQSAGRRHVALLAVLLAAGTAAVYAPAMPNGFVNLDDPDYVTRNPYVLHGLTWTDIKWALGSNYPSSNWHPLTWISHMTDVQLYGLHPAGHHLTNVALHVLAVVLLFLLIERATGQALRSAAVAALFAVQPLNVEAVAWISERKSVLCVLFFLLGIIAYGWYVKKTSVWRYSLLFAPGGRFEYSNAGYIVLGAIIEALSGQDYYSYVREHIYTPAGMRETDAYETDADVPNLATGYTRVPVSGPPPGGPPREGPRRSNIHIHPVKGGPAGGGYSTVGDLLRFGEALRNHRLLSPAITAVLLEGKVEMTGRQGVRYGYGFAVQDQGNGVVVGHSGGAPGIGSMLDIYLDRPVLTAMLTNSDPWEMQPVTDRLRQLSATMS